MILRGDLVRLTGALVIGLLALLTPRVAAQQVVACDHSAAGDRLVWLVVDASGATQLVTARDNREAPVVRCAVPGGVDVLLDRAGTGAFLLTRAAAAHAVSHVALDSTTPPRVLASALDVVGGLGRSGDRAILLLRDAVLAVEPDGPPKRLFDRDDPTVTAVAISDDGGAIAIEREGTVAVLDDSGEVAAELGTARLGGFISGTHRLLVTRTEGDLLSGNATLTAFEPDGRRDIVSTCACWARTRVRPTINGDACCLVRHAAGVSLAGAAPTSTPWLVHVGTSIGRRILPDDRARITVDGWPTPPASRPAPGTRTPTAPHAGPAKIASAVVQPEAEPAGPDLGWLHGATAGRLTATGGSAWALAPAEGATLVGMFTAGLRFPLRLPTGYVPFFGADDEPLRQHSPVPHYGLDVGARLVHQASGSIAHALPGAPVRPLWEGQGASTWAVGREPEQTVMLTSGAAALRVRIRYVHVVPAPLVGRDITVDTVIGTLPSLPQADDLDGGWVSSDPLLLAGGITKGPHVHAGFGGLLGTWTDAPPIPAHKLALLRTHVIPGLMAAGDGGPPSDAPLTPTSQPATPPR